MFPRIVYKTSVYFTIYTVPVKQILLFPLYEISKPEINILTIIKWHNLRSHLSFLKDALLLPVI
jgi:hypothetical protein